jgi:hypothetical protein
VSLIIRRSASGGPAPDPEHVNYGALVEAIARRRVVHTLAVTAGERETRERSKAVRTAIARFGATMQRFRKGAATLAELREARLTMERLTGTLDRFPSSLG